MVDWKRKEIRIPSLCEPVSHYTDAVRFGPLLFISGMVALDAEQQLIGEGDVVAQARVVFESLEKVLTSEGASFADVLKVTVYLQHIEDRTRINPIRQEFFGETRPASTLIEVANLAIPGLLVEVDAVAGIPG